MITRIAFTIAALAALAFAPAEAQQHRHGQGEGQGGMMMSCPMMQGMHGQGMMGQGMMGEGMHGEGMMRGRMSGATRGMGAMHTGPGMLLRSAEALELTAEQVEQLTALRDRVRPQHQALARAATEACGNAADLLESDSPDLDAYAEALHEAADRMVEAHVDMTRAALEARQLLTAEQLEKLDELMSDMHGGMGGRGPTGGGATSGGGTG